MGVCDTTIKEAEASARRMADKAMLPQTIYRDSDSSGWWHTNPLSPRLEKSEVFVTVLPARFFL